jgi:hypothetical protein
MLLGSCALVACAEPSGRSHATPIAFPHSQDKLPWNYPGEPDCAFPNAADAAKIDTAVVAIRVLVKADGSPQKVQTVEEPGSGFGPAAIRCAMARTYEPATDDNGNAIDGWTPPIRIVFRR